MKNEKAKSKSTTTAGKVRHGIAWSLGFTDLAAGFRAVGGGIAQSGHRMIRLRDGWKSLIAKSQKRGRVETFEQAVERLNLTPEFLKVREKQFFREGIAFLIAETVVFYSMFSAVLRGDWLSAVPALCLSLFVGACVFRAFFRHWQIVERRLDGPRDFIRATFLGV